MKKITLLLTTIMIIILAGCSSGTISNYVQKDINSANNLISNSSFEIVGEIKDHPEGWVIIQEEDVFLCTEDEKNSGYTCLKIEDSKAKTSIISDSFTIDPAGVYLSRCFVRADEKSEEPVELILITFDNSGNKLNTHREEIHPDGEWQELRLTSSFFNSKAKKARLTIVVPGAGNVFIDDVESYKLHRFAFSQK